MNQGEQLPIEEGKPTRKTSRTRFSSGALLCFVGAMTSWCSLARASAAACLPPHLMGLGEFEISRPLAGPFRALALHHMSSADVDV